MNKYKKIFSGLGLLSISTLIGASVVACANKKPKASDSSTEAIDQNNNQGNSTTPEQEKPEMPQNPAPGTDHNNQEKPETPKEGTPAPNVPSTPTPEMPKDTPEQNGNTGQSNDSKNNTQDENKGEAGKNDSKQEDKPAPTPQLPGPKVTVETKSMELLMKIEKLPYPAEKAPAKEKLRKKLESIKVQGDDNVDNDKKLEKLNKFDKELDQINKKLEEVISNIDKLPYPEKDIKLNSSTEKSAKAKFKEKLNDKATLEEISSVLPSDWEAKIKKYNEAINSLILLLNNTKIVNLKKGFIQTDNSIDDGRTESLLIYNIYETARPEYEKKIKALGLKDAQSYINKFTQIDKKHSHDAEWLSTKIKEMIQEYKKAMDAKNKMDTINNNKS
ncbi:hypothetical protein RRG53_00470 [Mycoplasmopsis cynos]|uniref:Vmc-like lipoprotein signal peptide domain-containing protein n=1 Tax=Mycoplasmopsis cynos TaxID=171284 RepID=UPI002AFE7BC8|nr:hypothetical protein [Mycoplasmopsis cynos]WQQ18537.1 hypothetical protein RRG53_00470 [Mycoplasmopsis cynos]